jgi:hypothetical protein
LRLEADLESVLRRLVLELELVVLRASEVDADRPPPIRALNMVGNDSEECPDGTGHHVERGGEEC